MKWSAYFAHVESSFTGFEDDSLYYEEDIIFTICPDSTLRARRGTVFINAENIIMECKGCTIRSDQCIACAVDYYKLGSTCTKCYSNMFFADSANICVHCSRKCKTCSSLTFCSKASSESGLASV